MYKVPRRSYTYCHYINTYIACQQQKETHGAYPCNGTSESPRLCTHTDSHKWPVWSPERQVHMGTPNATPMFPAPLKPHLLRSQSIYLYIYYIRVPRVEFLWVKTAHPHVDKFNGKSYHASTLQAGALAGSCDLLLVIEHNVLCVPAEWSLAISPSASKKAR